MKNYFISQFGHPRGIVGRLVGRIMAYENRERNEWAVSLLDVQTADQVLEIGHGPGLALQEICKRAINGFIVGVDNSAVMIDQAGRRNAEAIRDGCLELHQGLADSLPFENGRFDKVLVVNSVHHWPDAAAGLREVRRVLRDSGLAVFVEQPHGMNRKDVETAVRSRLGKQIKTAGYGQLKVQTRLLKGNIVVALLATQDGHQ